MIHIGGKDHTETIRQQFDFGESRPVGIAWLILGERCEGENDKQQGEREPA